MRTVRSGQLVPVCARAGAPVMAAVAAMPRRRRRRVIRPCLVTLHSSVRTLWEPSLHHRGPGLPVSNRAGTKFLVATIRSAPIASLCPSTETPCRILLCGLSPLPRPCRSTARTRAAAHGRPLSGGRRLSPTRETELEIVPTSLVPADAGRSSRCIRASAGVASPVAGGDGPAERETAGSAAAAQSGRPGRHAQEPIRRRHRARRIRPLLLEGRETNTDREAESR